MKTGVCPKCPSREIHRVPQTAVEVSIAISWSKTANLDYYVCTACGYVELYVADTALLPSIAEKYPIVN
jgi:predicted nucleic-acid-binding Zn-ribbon protein